MESLIRLIDDPRHRINETGLTTFRGTGARHSRITPRTSYRRFGRDEIGDELNKIGAEISEYLEILSSRLRIMQIVKDELTAVRDEFGTPRRSEIRRGGPDMDDEDLIAREDMVVTVSHLG